MLEKEDEFCEFKYQSECFQFHVDFKVQINHPLLQQNNFNYAFIAVKHTFICILIATFLDFPFMIVNPFLFGKNHAVNKMRENICVL